MFTMAAAIWTGSLPLSHAHPNVTGIAPALLLPLPPVTLAGWP